MIQNEGEITIFEMNVGKSIVLDVKVTFTDNSVKEAYYTLVATDN